MISRKEVILIACKLFGLSLLVNSVEIFQYLVGVVFFETDGFLGYQFLLLLVSFGLYVGMSFFLIMRSSKIVDLLLRKDGDATISIAIDKKALFQIVFVIIGLFTLIDVFPYLLGNFISWIKLELTEEFDYNFRTQNDNLLYSAIKATVGILLMANSKRLAVRLEESEKSDEQK